MKKDNEKKLKQKINMLEEKIDKMKRCKTCNGEGMIECSDCQGTGEREE
jgi:DnaJ-class molecular chaperone